MHQKLPSSLKNEKVIASVSPWVMSVFLVRILCSRLLCAIKDPESLARLVVEDLHAPFSLLVLGVIIFRMTSEKPSLISSFPPQNLELSAAVLYGFIFITAIVAVFIFQESLYLLFFLGSVTTLIVVAQTRTLSNRVLKLSSFTKETLIDNLCGYISAIFYARHLTPIVQKE